MVQTASGDMGQHLHHTHIARDFKILECQAVDIDNAAIKPAHRPLFVFAEYGRKKTVGLVRRSIQTQIYTACGYL